MSTFRSDVYMPQVHFTDKPGAGEERNVKNMFQPKKKQRQSLNSYELLINVKYTPRETKPFSQSCGLFVSTVSPCGPECDAKLSHSRKLPLASFLPFSFIALLETQRPIY